MEETINCLIGSAFLPLSVIIVGIGNANFDKMDILDGDDGLWNSKGVKAERDLVQFVPYNKFKGNKELLAREVLEEVPRQLVDYMKSQKIVPKQTDKVDVNKVIHEEHQYKRTGNNRAVELKKSIFNPEEFSDMDQLKVD